MFVLFIRIERMQWAIEVQLDECLWALLLLFSYENTVTKKLHDLLFIYLIWPVWLPALQNVTHFQMTTEYRLHW
jgi:hypothetical protein